MPIRSLVLIVMVSAALLSGCGPKSLNASERALCAEPASDNEYVPLLRVPPRYPTRAARNGVEGWVLMASAIRADGTLSKVRVTASEPAGVFDRAAVNAFSQWRYCPTTDPNSPDRPVTVKLQFDLAGY